MGRAGKMKGWLMYGRIQAMKEEGFSIRQVSSFLKVSRNTIRKYWEMTPEEYSRTYKTVNRISVLKEYEHNVVKWLEAYPCMTSAQVRDWLEEKYQLDACDRTVRRFVAELRKRHGISKESEPRRDYEAVEELPKGYQLQLDFGVKTVRDAYRSRYIKLYFVIFTLSYSKNKWGIFQDRPFLTSDLIRSLYGCFEYFGGMPRQLVYDQDSILVVSENYGDIIHTQAFASFLSETKLEVRVCRKSDPESKGLVEASVKFVKGNFMANRIYMGLDIWNQSFEKWLIRTGNGQKHGTTKRKPAEMFSEEQEHLIPLFGVAPVDIADDMERQVRKDNTVLYLSNRYSLPLGTYGKEKTVFLTDEDGQLHIHNRIGELLATHKLSTEKGKLIKKESHRRNRSVRIEELRNTTVALLGEEFREYLTILCKEKPRYVKEQFELIIQTCKDYGRERVLEAMRYCQESALYSATDLSDTVKATSEEPNTLPQANRLLVEDERYHIPVQKRPLAIYAEIATESGVLR